MSEEFPEDGLLEELILECLFLNTMQEICACRVVRRVVLYSVMHSMRVGQQFQDHSLLLSLLYLLDGLHRS